MHRFVAAVATFLGRPPEPGPTAMGDASALTEPPANPAPTAEPAEERRKGTAPGRTCAWCSAAIGTSDALCPNCGATLDSTAADAMAIPGLTELQPRLRRYDEEARTGKRKRQSLLAMILSDAPIPTVVDAPQPSDADALRPPSAAVRAEMARLDEDIATGGAPEPPDGPGPEAPQDSAAGPAGGEQRP